TKTRRRPVGGGPECLSPAVHAVLLVGCAALQEEADTNRNSLRESEATHDVTGW
ncbi:T-Lymphoma Invasion And Metastasis-Inducing Protein 1, partial [Manis pentadactyla]